MVKRMIAWVLSLALVLSVLPIGILAEDEIVVPDPHSHSAAQHNCEHCEDSITWTAWDKTDSLPSTTGHYYLTADVTPTAQTKVTGTNDVVICLNGYSIDGGKLSTSTLYVQDKAELTISDCTAYTDADGVFHAGALKNGRAGGSMSGSIYSKHNCKVAVYNCIVTGSVVKYNESSSAAGNGGAIHMRGDLAGDAPTLHLENVWFENNTAGFSAGALSVNGSKTTPVVTVKNCTFKGNSAPTGGAVYMTKTNATFEKCTFTENKSTANSAGNIQIKNTTAVFDGCTVENNEAAGTAGSAFYIHGGSSKVTLKDTAVTGNKHTGTATTSRAGIYVTNKGDKLLVTGKTVVKGNVIAADGTPVERNIFMQTSPNAIDVSGLTNGSSISVWTNWGTDTTPTFVTAATAPAAWSSAWVLYENNGMAVDYNETDKFHFVENLVHEHCICGITGCASTEHEKVLFQPWTGTTELPTSGTYYLTENVTLSGAVTLSEDVTLCLNGHTVTQGKADNRVLTVKGNARITSCKDGGTITGGKSTGYGGGITVDGSAAKLELNNVTVSGNTAKTNGGGIDVRNNAKLSMIGGTVTGNESVKDGGGLYAQKGTEVTLTDTEFSSNKVTGGAGGGIAISGKATLTGLTIQKNKSGNGGGMIVQGEGDVTMTGGTVSGNETTGNGGGIYVSKKLTLNGTSVTGNTATKSGDGIYVATTEMLTVTGETVIKDNGDANLYLSGTTNVIFGKLTGKANIGISVKDNAARAISGETAEDPTAYLFSDNSDLQPAYKEKIVSLEAAVKHSHCLCGGEGDGCDHTGVNFTKWDKTDSLPTSGKYFLDCDVTLTAEHSVSGDLTLCLNGHTITAANKKRIMSNPKNTVATIVISDCTAKTVDGVYTAGKLTGGNDVSGNSGGGAIYVRAGGVLKLYDGIISDCTSTSQGGAICLADTTKMEMHGGEISDCTAVSADGKTWKKGGAIAAYKAELTITDGIIRDNKATNGAVSGNNGSTVTITGGTVTGNWSKSDGGGVYVNKSGLYISGTAKIYGNETTAAGANICYGGSSYGSVSDITVEGGIASAGAGAMVQNGAVVTFTNVTFKNNSASNLAGALRLYKATLTMTDCTITGNMAANNGGAIYADTTADLTIVGGTITGNTAGGSVGGVRIDGTSSLTLKGKPQISGNAGGNLLLIGGVKMDVTGVTDGAEVWLSADMGPISTPCDDLTQCFKSESVYRSVIYKDGALYMATDGSHKHCYCMGKANECDHEIVEWVAWESTTSLPTSGNYYLLNDIVLTGEQSISSDVSICLNGKTVTAADGKRHISTVKDSGASIVICDCTATTKDGVYTAGKLTGGVDTSGNTGGGSLYIRAGSKVDIYDGIICNNYSTLVGGAIALNGASELTVHGGEISGNKTYTTSLDENGQEVIDWNDGGAIFITAGNDIKILGGTIKDNEGSGGGGIRFNGTGDLLIAGGTITGNTSHGQGGGVFASKTTVTITGGQIINNQTTSSAGGLCLGTGAQATMSGGVISGNSAVTGGGYILQGSSVLTMTGGEISGNTASGNGGGGALYSKAELHMQGGKISGNTSGSDGGGIYTNKAGVYIYENALISGNKVTGSAKNGGGISYGTESYGKITGGIIEKNQAAGGGGGLMVQNRSVVEITNVIVRNNTALTSIGGGVRGYKATLTISGGTFQNNKAVKSGGGGIAVASECTFTMTGGTVKNNTAKTAGGGISSNKCTTNISGVTVTGNSNERDGAGIYNTAGVMNIKGGVVSANNYTKGNGGGFCYGSKSSGYISGITVYGNTVDGGGGGAIIQGGANVTIGYISMTGNTAKKTSGGIYVYKANLTMTGGNISGNTAGGSGGGIYATDSETVKLSNVTISKNTGSAGGGLYMYRTKLILKDSVISENISKGSGTGIYSSGGTWQADLAGGEVTNTKIVGNQGGVSNSGGAVYMNTDVEMTFTDCEITDNYSENYCGGIYAASGSVPTVINCTFTGNESLKNAGALYTGDSGTITGCVFKDNKADKGAGLFVGNYMERWACNGWGNKRDFETGVTITDCTFEGNDAVTDGGGFHLDMSGYVTMDNCTFTGNSAGVAGSAMWLWENCTMTNITVTGNVCANNGHALVLADSEFDGQTYINGLFKMGGDMIVKDNEGGDLYMDNMTTIGALAQGYSPKTHMNITLDKGLLTQRVDGYYNYEGGNLVYTLTYGERSMTDPEYDPNLVVKAADEGQEQKTANSTDILLYVGIGVIGLAAVAGVVLMILKKKKPASAEQK